MRSMSTLEGTSGDADLARALAAYERAHADGIIPADGAMRRSEVNNDEEEGMLVLRRGFPGALDSPVS